MPIHISDSILIPDSDIRMSSERSAGPGGQHVNKINSRVILEFDLSQSAALNPYQKRRILDDLGNRINQQGILRLQSQRHRSQAANRADVLERFTCLIQNALRPPKHRIPTRVPRTIHERRLDSKKRQSEKKRTRQIFRNGEDS